MKSMKWSVAISAILTIAIGVILILNPDTIPVAVCKLIGAVLILIGAVGLVSSLFRKFFASFLSIGSILILLLGLWFFTHPQAVLSLIPIFMGILLLIHGLQDIRMAMEAHSTGYRRWLLLILLGIASVILGIFCIGSAFELFRFGMILIGVALVYDGVSDLWILYRVGSSAKEFRRAFKQNKTVDYDYDDDIIDVDYEETDID